LKVATGNEAAVDAALAAGCKLFAGYPVTPATEILESAAVLFPAHGREFIAAESEIGAIHMVAGASLAGYRAMTATTGLGLSLMSEALSFFSGMAELPGLVVCQQRWGPGDGCLGPGQDSYHMATRAAGHGDFRLIVLAPASAQETADHVLLGFGLADLYRIFVIVLGDHLSALTSERYEIGGPLDPIRRIEPFMAAAGSETFAIIPELAQLDSKGGDFHVIAGLARRWEAKYQSIRDRESRWDGARLNETVDILLVAHGSLARVAVAAIPLLDASGIRAAVFRPITLWPFPEAALQTASRQASRVIALELSMGQMVDDVALSIGRKPEGFVNWLGGESPSPAELAGVVLSNIDAPSGNKAR
jgi:pyruvate/2-oxoacid:ferredoxin oxidoreductase alpha subunit